jgi:hypothetical protein
MIKFLDILKSTLLKRKKKKRDRDNKRSKVKKKQRSKRARVLLNCKGKWRI